MCEVPGLGIDIPSPLDVVRAIASHPRAVATLVGGTAVVAFTVEYAVLVSVAIVVFAGVLGSFTVWTRKFRAIEVTPLPPGVRVNMPPELTRGAPVLPRNLAITTGQRALPAPAEALPAAVITGRVVGQVPAQRGKVVG